MSVRCCRASATERPPDQTITERQRGAGRSNRLAARLLGVTHTALERWIKSGDLPTVLSPRGRGEIPVGALLDLYETVQAEQAQQPSRYILTPTMTRQRQAARRLRPKGGQTSDGHRGHDRARARSLAYHRAVARRLCKPMVAEASHVLFRWRQQGRIDPRYAKEWAELLAKPLPDIRRAITAPGPHADDLRQNSPLAGLLSEPEGEQRSPSISPPGVTRERLARVNPYTLGSRAAEPSFLGLRLQRVARRSWLWARDRQ
jgi:hypothetical protein